MVGVRSKEGRNILTMSVSDTGPKLVTKMFVLTSVTVSEDRDNKDQKTLQRSLCTKSFSAALSLLS